MPAEDLSLWIDGKAHGGLLSIEFEFAAENALLKVTAGVVEGKFFIDGVGVKRPLTRRGAEAILKDGKGEVLVTGWVRRNFGDESKPAFHRFLAIESKACDAVECAADGRKHGYRLKGKKLGAAAKTLFKDYKVPVKVETDSREMDIAWAPGDRMFDVIETRARKAGLLMTGTADGGVALYKGTRGRHPGEFIVGDDRDDANATTLQFEDSEVSQFSKTHYHGQRFKGGKGKNETDAYATVENEAVRRLRIDIQRLEHDGDEQDLKTRTEWDNKRAAGGNAGNGTQIVIGTPEWRDPDGKIWTAAFIRYVIAGDWDLDQDMAIKSGQLSWSKEHQLARLTMVEPRSLGGKDPKGKSGATWKVSDKKAKAEELS